MKASSDTHKKALLVVNAVSNYPQCTLTTKIATAMK
jgi:hypothetical protein